MMFEKRMGRMLLTVIAIVSMLFVSACSSNEATSKNKDKQNSAKEAGTPQNGGTISIGYTQEPDTMDVHKTSMSIVDDIGTQIGGSLLVFDPKTLELKPHLAESYSISEDGKKITFKLREGIKFHDGTPFTAKAYKETFDRLLDPKTGATVVKNLLAGVKSIKAPDDATLIIELAAPTAPVLSNLAIEGFMQPLSKKAIDTHGDKYGRNPVGVGPWKFKEWKNGQSITLAKNEDYKWSKYYFSNKGSAYPDELVYKFIKDYQTMLSALDSGSIDIAANLLPKDAKRYSANPQFNVFEFDRQGMGLTIEMNTENEILKDIKVRKALNMLINKDSIIKAVLQGEGNPAYGPISSNIFGYDKNIEKYGYQYNKDEAVKLLKSSGWKKNSKGMLEKDGKELSFELSSSGQWNQPAQIVQAMFKEAGIGIKIQSFEAGALSEKVSKGDYELTFLGYSYPDPDILFMLFHSSQLGGFNHSRAKNKELDALLEKGRATLDSEERKKIYAEAQKIIVEEAYWAPIYVEKMFFVSNKRVHGLKQSQTTLLFHDSWVKK
ncbi:ABC transporter substrate-binding protein [Fictibacillus fluitans]|uniref:ABC transporter substrate-binding protein n=1 Tax=Fictibacillus fluitans TaxID=3058422 RepID=A0ABT8HTD1_9BACL|nr:ABC transporter substrate-binding protein [Fictibacillus sp. NE201]MDN4524040.1 ABC transporter substrate-binding protein [Fictibacillus sp. NE201]